MTDRRPGGPPGLRTDGDESPDENRSPGNGARVGHLTPATIGPSAQLRTSRAPLDRARALAPFVVFLLATFAFMPQSLLGQRTKSSVDMLETSAPYRDAIGRAPHVGNPLQVDIVDGEPMPVLFFRSLRDGHWQNWDPRSLGGTPLGTLPFMGLLSPTSIGFLFLPAWYAVTVKVALLLLISQTFMYLLMRRWGSGTGLAVAVAVAYTFSGANMVLLQRVDALFWLPALFWAVHHTIDRPSARWSAAIAVLTASAWFEGFPSGFVYCLGITAAWALWLSWRRLRRRRETGAVFGAALRGTLPATFAIGSGFVLGLLVAAIDFLPLTSEVASRGIAEARSYGSRAHLPANQFFGLFDLGAIGKLTDPGDWWSGLNPVESVTFIGSIVSVGLVFALAWSWSGRLVLTREGRDAWPFLCALFTVLLLLLFTDTVGLNAFYALPGVGNNLLTRARFGIAFAAAPLAGLAVDAWWRRRRPSPDAEAPPSIPSIVALMTVIVLAVAFSGGFLDDAEQAKQLTALGRSAAISLGLAALAVAIVWAVSRRRTLVAAGSVLLSGLLFVQLAVPFRSFVPESPVSDFYRAVSGHRSLLHRAGNRYRVAGTDRNFNVRSSSIIGWFDLRGPGLWAEPMRSLVKAANPTAFSRDPFRIILARDEWDLGSPVYDDLGVRYFALGTGEAPYGSVVPTAANDGEYSWVDSTGVPASRPAPVGLAGAIVPVRTVGDDCDRTHVRLTVRQGDRASSAARPGYDATVGGWLSFALVDPGFVAGVPTITTVALEGSGCRLEAGARDHGDELALRWIVLDTASPVRVVSTDQAWLYERRTAWPLVSSHGRWRAFANQRSLLAYLRTRPPAESDVAAFVGHGPASPTGSSETSVERVRWGDDTITMRTSGAFRSLVAVSQAFANGWTVQVDGRSAPVVSVDGALLGTFVAPGSHLVQFRYEPQSFRTGRALTLLALAVIGVITCAPLLRRRTRRSATTSTSPVGESHDR